MYLRNDGTLVIIAKKGEDTNIQPYLYNFSDYSID